MKNKYSIKPVFSSECYEWFLKKHYARRLPNINCAYGLYDHLNLLQGVCSFGKPMSHTLVSGAVNGLYQNNFLELNRLVINDGFEKNVLSFFVSQSLRLLPKPNAVVSYADTSLGHHGYIYQACNFIYTGLSFKKRDYTVEGLEHLHNSSLIDMVGRDNRGDKVGKLKKMFGDRLYLKERPRKHRYFYFVGDKKTKKIMKNLLIYDILPYPKGDNKRYDASYEPSVQGVLF